MIRLHLGIKIVSCFQQIATENRGGSRVRLVRQIMKSRFLKKWGFFMKYENMKEVSHGFCKKYKIPQKLVCVMITVNISCNLRRCNK